MNHLLYQSMKLVTLKIFDNPIEAHILKTKLESEEIQCYLFDENTVSINPLYNITVGGIKLKIDENNLSKAQKIINDIENKPFTDENEKVIVCPNCQSKNFYSGYKSMKGLRGVLSIIITFLFGVYPIYFKTVYKCKDCDTEFKK